MNIPISNHPAFNEIVRKYEASEIQISVEGNATEMILSQAKVLGFVKNANAEGETPLGFDVNGKYIELIADNNTRVDSQTGNYTPDGDVGELDYLGNFTAELIGNQLGKPANEVTLPDFLFFILLASTMKQDALGRFNKS